MDTSKRMRLDGHRDGLQAATSSGAAVVSPSNGGAQPNQQAGAGSKLEAFLSKLGLAQYTGIFVAKGLSAGHVRSMSDAQMREDLGMPQEHVSLLKRALGLPSAQPQPSRPAPPAPPAAQSVPLTQSLQPAPPQLPAAVTAPPPPPQLPGAGAGHSDTSALDRVIHQQEMMLKMLQMQEGVVPASLPNQAAVASGGAGNMLQTPSEEELSLIQLQMQMQMQVQLAMQAGADPTKALEAMAELQPKSTGHGMPATSPTQAQMMSLQSQMVSAQEETAIVPIATSDAAAHAPMAAGNDELFGEESAEMDNTLYALGQVAEEQAQLAVSAAAFCSGQAATDPVQIQALAEAAQQAAQRARWAAKTMEEYEPDDGFGRHWIATLRNIGKQAAEAAEDAAEQCSSHASGGGDKDKEDEEDPEQKGKVPCKFFLLGRCWKGNGCEFAHEQQDLKPRPLMLKREEECIYFARGQCTRGVACPFAHGPEELAEISKYVVTLKKEKNHFSRNRR